MKEKGVSRVKKILWRHIRIVGVSFFILSGVVALTHFHGVGEKVGNIVEPNKVFAHYQFTPTNGTVIIGGSTSTNAVTAATTEGANTGSWKGTLADDAFHWIVPGAGASGLDINLTVGGMQLNGANKLIIQTEFDLDATVLATEVQICDWVSSTDVDDAADAECTGGGWRTLNTRSATQVPVALTHTASTAFQWHIYNGYWSTGTTGGTPVNTPLTNFVNGGNQTKIRYFSTTNSTSEIAIDFLRIYAIVDPVYHAGGFTQISGGTVAGHYGNTFSVGNTGAAQQAVTTGDAIFLDVPGTAATSSNFYFTFKNIKTYTGMNTILVNAETLCSAATADLQYRFKIRNFTTALWEDMGSSMDCSATGFFNNVAANNVDVDDYINGTDEIWVGIYSLATTTTNIRVDSIYLILGTTNTDTNSCEITFGENTSGRIATNPSAPGADRIQAMISDGTSFFAAGYDNLGNDNRWRIEKRNLSDGELVSAFGVNGATTTDPSATGDQIFALATTTGAIFAAGFDIAVGGGQWRIEKRNSTTGALITAFDTDGIVTTNPAADIDQITAIATDASYLYVTGYEDDDTGVWRTHKYDITTGALVPAFAVGGVATQTLSAAAGDERPQAIKVDSDYLYIAGYDNVAGNSQWRIEKRNKTTGALCAGGGECTAGAFDTDGIIQTNPSANTDRIYAMAIDGSYIYVAGYDSVVSAADGQWRIEKRDIATGALVGAFDTDGIVQVNPFVSDVDWVTDMVIDDTRIYLGGFRDDDAGSWYIESRDKVTGALDNNFSSNGSAISEDGGDDRLNAMILEGGYLYAGGYGTAPGDNQWLLEKRSTTTGLRSHDSFGGNDCSGTRDMDTTSGNRNAWAIRTDDESTNSPTPYYPLDNDGDAIIEEAGASHIGFSTVLPPNAAVAGLYWATRAMSGAGGTVRPALKDYSGLTGVTGGRSLIGAAANIAMVYTDPLTTAGVASGGMAGFMTNPEDHIDTRNNQMNVSLVTTAGGASTTNSVNAWDFAMVSFSWIEDVDHPGSTYQFVPTQGAVVAGVSTSTNSAIAAANEGANTGSWKGTLADDAFHWIVAGAGASGLDINLTVGGVQLNGANKLIIQTEFDLDATVLATEVQICDWASSTSVDDAADAECTGGGWRTLNTRNATQVPVALTHTGTVAFQWHIFDGYWSTGTTGGTAVNTPLSNFVNGGNQIKIRYFSTTNTTSEIAIDYLRVYAIVDPVYHAGGFVQESGGTVAGHYGNTHSVGNIAASQQVVTTGDGIFLDVPGTAATSSNFYLTFKNIKTYTGMNTILVNAETLCSAATAGVQYRLKIRNFSVGAWEDISAPIDCSATGFFNNFSVNNIAIDDYINGSDEIWVGTYSLGTTTTNIRIDSMYLILGTTNSDTNKCEISIGENTAGRITINPSAPGSDRIQALTSDGTSMYLAGYDSSGIDNRWRVEKRNLSDGELVSAFSITGATTTDPSAGADQIFAIATTSGAIFLAGNDIAVGAGQWRIEKRDSTTGTLITAFDTDGIITFNPAADIDQITAITTDASYLYATGYEDDDTGVWRTHKYDITTGAVVAGFGVGGVATATLAATGDERPQAIKVDADYLYIGGYDNVAGNIQWRIEKRNKTTGALCAGGGECVAGAFDTDGVIQTNPSANIDAIYAIAIDSSYIYAAGYDSVVGSGDGQWRIEKRDIATGALVVAFDGDGFVQTNPFATDNDWVTTLVVSTSSIYAGGFRDDDAGAWYLEKRDITTGALDVTFSDNGISLSEDGGDDRLNAMVLEGGYLFLAGYGTGPTENQWLLEKRVASTGLRSNDSFGSNDCSGTRDINTTAGNKTAWTVRTDDESTNFPTPFYALDNDGDAVLEEAGATNVTFSVTVPTNASVAGIYWAGRSMSGAGGTVRPALKDYSGLTGVTGGRSLVGSSPTINMAYTDPLVVAGVASGGMAGFMTNPEDHIDTRNNEMNLSLVTTLGGASTTNSLNVWDFGMVSFSWIEPIPAPVYSISITSDGTIEYGFVDLNTSSSTVGGDTQTAENVGSTNEQLNVRSSNAIGGVSWLLASVVDTDEYTHEFSTTTGATWTIMPDSSTYVAADPFVVPSDTVDFDFRLTVPDGTTDFVEKSITITVQAVAP